MPQFDLLTIGVQIFGLLILLFIFYYYNLFIILPTFIETKKLRTKKITKNTKIFAKITNDINCNIWLITYYYKNFFK